MAYLEAAGDGERLEALARLERLGPSAAGATSLVVSTFLSAPAGSELRNAALRTLGAIGDPRATPTLIEAAGEGEVRAALVRIAGRDLGPEAEAWRRWWDEESRIRRWWLYRCGSSARLWIQSEPLPRSCPWHGGLAPECGEEVAVLEEADSVLYSCPCAVEWRQPPGEVPRCPSCPEADGCGTVAGFAKGSG